MAGFGESFSRSFERQRDISEKRKEDLFQKTYENFIKNKAKYDEEKATDTKAISKAKSLSEQYGQPPEAWSKIYEWIKEGQSDSDIRDILATGKFSVEQKGSEKIVSEKPVQPPIIQQPATQLPKAPQIEEDTGLFGKLFGKGPNLLGQTGTIQERNMQWALDRTSKSTGASTDEINQVMGGYKPQPVDSSGISFTPASNTFKNLPDNYKDAFVKAQQYRQMGDLDNYKKFINIAEDYLFAEGNLERIKTIQQNPVISGQPAKTVDSSGQIKIQMVIEKPDGTFVDKEGNPVQTMTRTENEMKAEDDIISQNKDNIKDIIDKKVNLNSMYESAGLLSELGEKNPAILTNWSRNTSSFLASKGQDLNNLYSMITSSVKESLNNPNKKFSAEELALLEKRSDYIKEKLGPLVNDTSAQAALANIHTNLMAYRLGMILGQSGRGLAETERKMFLDIFSDSVDPTKYNVQLASTLASLESLIDHEAQLKFGPNSGGEKFAEEYGYNPLERYSKPVSESLTENAKRSYTKLQKFAPIPGSIGVPEPTSTLMQPQQQTQPKQLPQGMNPNEWWNTIQPGEAFVDPGDGKTYIKE